jgi:hypothetical protein
MEPDRKTHCSGETLLGSLLLPFWKGCMSHFIGQDERRRYGNSEINEFMARGPLFSDGSEIVANPEYHTLTYSKLVKFILFAARLIVYLCSW